MYCFKSPLFYFVVWQGNYGHELQITVLPQNAHYAEGIYAFLFVSSFFYTYERNIIIVSLSSDIFIVMAGLQYFLGCLGTKFTALVYHKIGCRCEVNYTVETHTHTHGSFEIPLESDSVNRHLHSHILSWPSSWSWNTTHHCDQTTVERVLNST